VVIPPFATHQTSCAFPPRWTSQYSTRWLWLPTSLTPWTARETDARSCPLWSCCYSSTWERSLWADQ